MAIAKNAVTPDMLVSELQNLLRLTAFEQTIAAVRRSQAATSSIAEELRANYAKSVERSQLLQDAVRQAGGVPDVVGSALSKAGAFVQAQVNQVQTLQGALLGDLALEHQLRERTRYARTLAESLGYAHLLPLFERLDLAHTATIEWLEARLTEVAQTGTSAIEPTPVQVVVGATRKVALLPFGVFAATVNRGTSLLRRGASSTVETAGTAVENAREGLQSAAGSVGAAAGTAVGTVTDAAGTAAQAVEDGVETAADTVADSARTVADTVADTVASGAQAAADVVGEGAEKAADVTSSAAEATGEAVEGAARATEQATQTPVEQVLDLRDVDEDKAPFAGYDSLSGDSVMRHVRDSEDIEHLREILAYEQAHKSRKGVVGALDERLTELAGASA